MKTVLKSLILVVLTLSLVLALLACTNKKYDQEDWLRGDDPVEETGNVARKAETDKSEGTAAQGSNRLNLPLQSFDD